MKVSLASLVALLALFFVHSCKDNSPTKPKDPPLEPKQTIGVTLVDTTCTEVWLKLSFLDSTTSKNFSLVRNGTTIYSGSCLAKDTIIIDFERVPKTTYNYRARLLKNQQTIDSSNSIGVTTLDTTSHNYTWTTELLGEGYSLLRGVTIVNDTLVYAVGQMFKRDSTGRIEIEKPYCLAKWNGSSWTLKQLSYYNPDVITGDPYGYLPEGYSIIVFGTNDIWIAAYSVFNWDGVSSQVVRSLSSIQLGSSVTKLWGTSRNNIYGVGPNGSIAHFDGTSWTKMESGTTVDLTDISGSPDGKEVWACGYETSDGSSVILRLKNGVWEKFGGNTVNSLLYNVILGVWSCHTNSLYIAHDGSVSLFNTIIPNNIIIGTFQIGALAIRGSSKNNVGVCGDGGFIRHWNGITWESIQMGEPIDNRLYSLALSQKLFISVGVRNGDFPYRYGLVIMGKK
jgi:hypothetical protein